MKIGMIGLGKLGMPIAQAIAECGHEVKGYDIVPVELMPVVESSNIRELVNWADIIFAAPQTPHSAEYEGTTRLPASRADFDYSYLEKCVYDVAEEAMLQGRSVNLVVISTCLPGTFEREIQPLLNDNVNYLYQPLFIAMGTEIQDFLNPEFVLIGGDNPQILEEFYKTIHNKELLLTDITTAEGIKVSYNTWITAKTVIANVWGEIAYKMGMDFPAIYKAWSLATDRIISPKYMQAGMSDGGACHPRDNIALSWLAREIGLSHDIFSDLMTARQDHEDWHADLAMRIARDAELQIIVLGKGFKPGSSIETGSAALLLANMLHERSADFSHHEDIDELPKAVYFIATNHKKYQDYNFPTGSIVINPSTKELVRYIT